MKFKRLTDNLPAYKAGEIYEVIVERLGIECLDEYHGVPEEDRGFTIKNRIGSQFYFPRYSYLDKIEFDRKWKRVE